MGEVYRARDPRLGRDVAIKVLLDGFASDPERLRRFEQEARASGALNHPGILVVLDVGTHEGAPYLVSELLEGESLRERLRRGALPLRKALEYGAQIAQGLAAAHEKGIVHRDIKPENLFLTKGGRVKILDFGLAKLRRQREDEVAEEGVTESTATGAVLGTASYMSPEQVRGVQADHRSDIFSLGIVLYEMLSRERPFKGQTSAETMTAILRQDAPELSGIDGLSPVLDRVVRRCLEKSPDDRFHSAHDLGLALEAVAGQTGAEPKLKVAVSTSRFVAGTIGLFVLVLIGATAFLSGKRAGHVPPPVFHQLTFRRGTIFNARFAPDGASVIYGGKWEEDQYRQLYAQRLDAIEARSLGLPAGTGLLAVGPGELAVSDDQNTLARVPPEGGGLRKVLDDVEWADWSADGARLAVARDVDGRQWIEFPIGKTVYETTTAGIVELRVSPDGKRLAFMEQVIATDSRVAISVLDEAGRKATLSAGWDTLGGLAWSPDGKEVWFTASRAAAAPSLYAVSVAGQERLVLSIGAGLELMDVSRDGRVLLTERELRGEVRGAPDGVHERSFSWLDFTVLGDLSADGKNLLFSEWGQAGGPPAALYLRGLADPVPTRLGDGLAFGLSPDGAWALVGARVGMGQLHLVPTGIGETKVLAQGTLEAIMAACWFPDGRRIIVVGNEAGRPRRLFIQEVPDGLPRALTPEGVTLPRRGGRMTAASMVSPDGRFVAALISGGPSPRYAFFPTAGGPAIPIPGLGENDEPLRWSGDGKFLFVWGGWGTALPVRVERLDLRTGRKQPWKELRPPDSTGVIGIGDVLLAPDGGVYFYGYVRILSKLFIVEGLR
jgi:dipeptidyl aminopeptidase/acylaminoacyl peptidase